LLPHKTHRESSIFSFNFHTEILRVMSPRFAPFAGLLGSYGAPLCGPDDRRPRPRAAVHAPPPEFLTQGSQYYLPHEWPWSWALRWLPNQSPSFPLRPMLDFLTTPDGPSFAPFITLAAPTAQLASFVLYAFNSLPS